MKRPCFPLKIFYDGACPVCAKEVSHYCNRDHSHRLLPINISAIEFDPQLYGISLHEFMYELHVIDNSGEVFRGVEAFRAIWLAFPDSLFCRSMGGLLALPVINPIAQRCYRIFARLRPHLPGRAGDCPGGECRVGKPK